MIDEKLSGHYQRFLNRDDKLEDKELLKVLESLNDNLTKKLNQVVLLRQMGFDSKYITDAIYGEKYSFRIVPEEASLLAEFKRFNEITEDQYFRLFKIKTNQKYRFLDEATKRDFDNFKEYMSLRYEMLEELKEYIEENKFPISEIKDDEYVEKYTEYNQVVKSLIHRYLTTYSINKMNYVKNSGILKELLDSE